MSIDTERFYQAGGTTPPLSAPRPKRGRDPCYDAPCYVERRADRDLTPTLRAGTRALSRGEFCYVLTARQMGKSSLMVRTAARLRQEGVAVAVLDLTAIGQNLTVEQWCSGLLIHAGAQLEMEDELDEFWRTHDRLGPLQRWLTALREVVLSRVHGPIALFIDEIDAVRSLPFSTDEFFAGIRQCYNRRTEDPEFERLTFCLLGVAAPSDLIRDTRLTPFNIGRRIELADFSEAEAAPLADGLAGEGAKGRGSEGASEELLLRVLYWTGGHPYLTQRLCQAVASHPSVAPSPPLLLSPSHIVALCDELFLAKGAREQDDNLLFARERLLQGSLPRFGREADSGGVEADLAALLELYREVRQGRRISVDDTNPLIDLLRLAGIARVESGRLRVRNRIYAQVFDREWVTQHMPDAELRRGVPAALWRRRRQRRGRAAYRQGLMRATGVAGAVLAVVAGLAFTALGQARRARVAEGQASSEARQTRRLLYVANLNLAQQDWETSNISRLRQLLEETKESPERGFEWFYWQRLLHLDLRTLWIPEGRPAPFEFSPDGRRFVTGGPESFATIWDAETGRALRHLPGHSGSINAVAVSPDGRRIATSDWAGVVKVWEPATGGEVLTLKVHAQRGVRGVAFSPDGSRIVTGSYSGTKATVWDASSGKPLLDLPCLPPGKPGYREGIWSVAFSPDGRRIVTSGDDGTGKVWDAMTGRKLLVLGRHAAYVTCVAYSPDGRWIATSSADRLVKLWDAATGRELVTLKGHNLGVLWVTFSPDGRRVATGGWDNTVKLWNPTTGRETLTLKGHAETVTGVAFSPDGRRIVTSSGDGTAKVWDTATPQQTNAWEAEERAALARLAAPTPTR